MVKRVEFFFFAFVAALAGLLLFFTVFKLYVSVAAISDCKERGIPLIKCDARSYDIKFDSNHLKELNR